MQNLENIDKEVVLHLWVPYVLKKREVIMSQVTSRIRRTSHKYGIDMPEMASKLDMPEMASKLYKCKTIKLSCYEMWL